MLEDTVSELENTISKFKILYLQGQQWGGEDEHCFYLILEILAYLKEKGKHTLWG